jgi:CheY-like chemotaxis protein
MNTALQTKDKLALLVVDDEEQLRKAIAFDFIRKGYHVLEAANGKAAFELLKSNSIDVILTDVRMPNGDGVELLEMAKEYNAAMPVVMFITGFTDLTLADAYDKGAAAIFTKPFDRKALQQAVLRVAATKEELWLQRGCERTEITNNVLLQFPELKLDKQGAVLNIGRGGMFVALHNNFPHINAQVVFKIQFENGNPLALIGEGLVRWVRTQTSEGLASGCGIEFTFLDSKTRRFVFDLIDKTNMKAFIPKI